MAELITQEDFAAGLRIFLAVAFAACWAAGAVHGRRKGALRRGLFVGGAASLLAPLIYGLWLVYSWRIRYAPDTGEAGLHKVSVLLCNALVFVVVGCGVGLVAARLAAGKRDRAGDETEDAVSTS
jgi:MFS family permease